MTNAIRTRLKEIEKAARRASKISERGDIRAFLADLMDIEIQLGAIRSEVKASQK